jgi:hypothetical protein
MKNALLLFATGTVAFSACALDGIFSANNIIGGVRQYIYDLDGTTKLSVDQGAVQFVYNGAVVGAGTYPFLVAGIFSDGVLGIPNQAGQTVSITIDVWDRTTAPTYELAVQGGHYLPSQTVAITLGGVGGVPSYASALVGFTGGSLVAAPEPSTMALAVFGLGGLLLVRRRK